MKDRIKTFKEYMNEAKQLGVVYHFTRPIDLINIIKSDFNFESHNKQTISLTRNFKLSNPGINKDRGYICRITFDGDKITNKYKVKPILGKDDNYSNVWSGDNRVDISYEENEEAIIINKKINLKSYIISAEILKEKHTQEILDKLIELLNRNNIKYTFVDKFRPVKL